MGSIGARAMTEWRKAWFKTDQGRAYRNRSARNGYARRRAVIDTYKLSKGCYECGFHKWPEALDFDHLDRTTKRFMISQKMAFSVKMLMKEIVKCRVLCANCHRHKSKQEAPHGFNAKLA